MPWFRRITRKTSSARSPAKYRSIADSNLSISSATSGSRGRALSSSRLMATVFLTWVGEVPDSAARLGATAGDPGPGRRCRASGANLVHAATQLVLHLVGGAALSDARGAVGPDHDHEHTDWPGEMPAFGSGIKPTDLVEMGDRKSTRLNSSH